MDNLSNEAKDLLNTVEPVGTKFDEGLLDDFLVSRGSSSNTRAMDTAIVENLVKKEGAPSLKVMTPLRALQMHESIEKATAALEEMGQAAEKVTFTPLPKPVYVRPPHLMDRPFKGHEGLEALKEQLDKTAPASKKQNPRNSRANHPAGRGRNKKESN